MNPTSIYKSPEGEQIIMELYDDLLKRWTVPYETLTIPTGHGDTFIIASGDKSAPPLILLHGAGTNSAIWGQDMAKYTRTYRVYAVDLPGEPGKSSTNRLAWATPAYAEWLEDLLAALQIDQVTLVGISQGGWTALRFATLHPDRVANLVLMTPGGIVPDKLSFILWAVLYLNLGKFGINKLIQMLYADPNLPPEVSDLTAKFMTNFKGRRGVLPIFTDDELRGLTMPVLLLMGTQDAMRDGDKIAARMQQFIPRLKVRMIPGGHALLNTVDEILVFLNQNTGEAVYA